MTIDNKDRHKIIDTSTGELNEARLIVIPEKKTTPSVYGKDNWCRYNQKKGAEIMKYQNEELFTNKGILFYTLVDMMGYGNIVHVKWSEIAKKMGVSRQAIYKYKKDLEDNGFIQEVVNKSTGATAYRITNQITEKGVQDNDYVTPEEYEKMQKSESTTNRFNS